MYGFGHISKTATGYRLRAAAKAFSVPFPKPEVRSPEATAKAFIELFLKPEV
jgi:hypothetical protein